MKLLRALPLFLCALVANAKQPPAPRIVDLTAPDGVKLKATYFSAAAPGPGLILLHQCNRQRKVWDDLASRMAAAGLNVVTIDLRGYGDSEGTPFDKLSPDQANVVFNEKFPLDIETAYKFLLAQPGVSHELLAAGGASCGVNQSVHLAMHHPEIKALVLLSESTNLEGRNFLRNHASLPLFLATAEDDTDPGVSDLMQWISTLSTNPQTKFVRYKTGGHGVELFAAHPDLPPMIVDWLTTALKSLTANTAKPSPYVTPQTQFLEALDHTDSADPSQLLTDARRSEVESTPGLQQIVNRIGYDHLQHADKRGAIEILKLNTSLFPNSPNVYDSLGDAYLADGQNDLARQSAQKALDLLPSDTIDPEAFRDGIRQNAEQKLKKLAAPASPQ